MSARAPTLAHGALVPPLSRALWLLAAVGLRHRPRAVVGDTVDCELEWGARWPSCREPTVATYVRGM